MAIVSLLGLSLVSGGVGSIFSSVTSSLGLSGGGGGGGGGGATLTSIAVTPDSPVMAVGDPALQFTATGHYSSGPDSVITSSVTWASDNPGVATIDTAPGSAPGLASALSLGSSSISATLGAVSGATVLTVTVAPLTSIAVTPDSPVMAVGDPALQFAAIGHYSSGPDSDITSSVTWASDNPGVATIDTAPGSAPGLASALSLGSSSISATLGAVSGATVLTVSDTTPPSVIITDTSDPSSMLANANDDTAVAWAEFKLDGGAWSEMSPYPGQAFGVPNVNVVGNANNITVAFGPALQITSGFRHTCALVTGGTVHCWGINDYGQFGDGTTTNSDSPVAVAGLSLGATAIGAGDGHTCALLTNGTVSCWGANYQGQLGDGTTTDSSSPVMVAGLSGVTAISAGGASTCALLSDTSVSCWGANDQGQLGDGTYTDSSSPLSVQGSGGSGNLSGVTAISLSPTGHACALLADHTVSCWGFNYYGQFGDGTQDSSTSPVAVAGLSLDATAISAGDLHTCALLVDHTVRCWGYNVQGVVGDGTVTDRLSPVDPGLTGVTELSSKYDTTCAILGDASVKCWGYNGWAQIGDGTTTNRLNPTAVVGLSLGATAISAGSASTCALLTDGTVSCWGYIPVLSGPTVTTIPSLAPGQHTFCVRAADSSGNISAGTDCVNLTVN